MTRLTGLFLRGASYYIQVVLPLGHPLRAKYRNGKYVASLGRCTFREAVRLGTLQRAAILSGNSPDVRPNKTPKSTPAPTTPEIAATAVKPGLLLREVFLRWRVAKQRSSDSISACQRALCLYEEYTENTPLNALTREQGDGFRAWLQHTDRGTTTKTARDRLTWVKSLLKFATRDLGWLQRNPWEGIDFVATTTNKRRTWTEAEIQSLLSQPLFSRLELPTDRKAGGVAAYWIPLLGLFTGARVGELAQLRVEDIDIQGGIPTIRITNDGPQQSVKTLAAKRCIPIHSELIRLGILDYVQDLKNLGEQRLWPSLPLREGKPGGYFSAWFGVYRKAIGLGVQPDFHSFRHTVRSQLANANVSEQLIDYLIGHEVQGSTGAKVYTHRSAKLLSEAIELINYPSARLERAALPCTTS